MKTCSYQVFENRVAFLEHYRDTYCDFVYVKADNLFYTDFQGVEAHVEFMATKYTEITGRIKPKYKAADLFIEEGLGMFKSRAGNHILASDKFVLSDDLWFLRRDMEYI